MEIEAVHPDEMLEELHFEGNEWELRQLAMKVLEAAAEGRSRLEVGGTVIEFVRSDDG
jgi:hypothetical protein